jgi:hypothetical protein
LDHKSGGPFLKNYLPNQKVDHEAHGMVFVS